MRPPQGGLATLIIVLRCGIPHLRGEGAIPAPPQMEVGMTTLLERIQDRLRKRAAYVRTKSALKKMPLAVAIDLDLYKPDADKIAARAVYGH